MRGDGGTYQRGKRWWIRYYAPEGGRSVLQREPAIISDREGAPMRPARTEAEARRALKRRRDEVAVHRAGARPFQGPAMERVTFDEVLRGMERDYEARKLASLPSLRAHLVHVRAFFAHDRALAVTTERLRDFVVQQQRAGVSAQSIHHRLKAVRRAFRLAVDARLVAFAPAIPTVTVQNVRQGFVSRADYEAIIANLGELRGRGKEKRLVPDQHLQDFAAWAWRTGMRKSEIASLTWEGFDRETWAVRLAAKDAKTGHARTLSAAAGALRKILERRLAVRRLDCPLIFHRTSRVKINGRWQDLPGQPVTEFRKAWASALARTGLVGVLFHDLRRSAVRNMVRGGVSQNIAMKISGHRTDAIFRRYDIISEADVADAMVKTEAYVAALPRRRKVAPIGGRR